MPQATIYSFITALYILLIYAGSGVLRVFSEGIRLLFGSYLNVLTTAGLVAVLVMVFALRRIASKKEVLVPLALVCCGYSLMLWYLKIPEERLHLLQYGLLAFFIGKTVPERIIGLRRFLLVVGLATLVGIGDEIIQAIRPNRVGDLRDVFINGTAALLAQILLVVTSPRQAPQRQVIGTPRDT